MATSSVTVVNPLYLAPEAPRTIDEVIYDSSIKYGVSEALMRRIITCESQYQSVQSQIKDPTGPNGREDSWGVVQIHLPDWPEITKEQAMDYNFAVDFLAKKLSEGKGDLWSCYK